MYLQRRTNRRNNHHRPITLLPPLKWHLYQQWKTNTKRRKQTRKKNCKWKKKLKQQLKNEEEVAWAFTELEKIIGCTTNISGAPSNTQKRELNYVLDGCCFMHQAYCLCIQQYYGIPKISLFALSLFLPLSFSFMFLTRSFIHFFCFVMFFHFHERRGPLCSLWSRWKCYGGTLASGGWCDC